MIRFLTSKIKKNCEEGERERKNQTQCVKGEGRHENEAAAGLRKGGASQRNLVKSSIKAQTPAKFQEGGEQ